MLGFSWEIIPEIEFLCSRCGRRLELVNTGEPTTLRPCICLLLDLARYGLGSIGLAMIAWAILAEWPAWTFGLCSPPIVVSILLFVFEEARS